MTTKGNLEAAVVLAAMAHRDAKARYARDVRRHAGWLIRPGYLADARAALAAAQDALTAFLVREQGA